MLYCDRCNYERASDSDGRQFHEVCGICYQENCETPIPVVDICNECYLDEQDAPLIIDPGESLFT